MVLNDKGKTMAKLSEVAKRRPTGKASLKGVEFVVQMVPASVNEAIVRQLPEPTTDHPGRAQSKVFQADRNRCYANRRCMVFLAALDCDDQLDDDDRWTPERNGDWCNAHAASIKQDFTESEIATVVHTATFELVMGSEAVEIGTEDVEGN